MKGPFVFALLLLAFVAVGHVMRILFSVEVSVGGDAVPVWWARPPQFCLALPLFCSGATAVRRHRHPSSVAHNGMAVDVATRFA